MTEQTMTSASPSTTRTRGLPDAVIEVACVHADEATRDAIGDAFADHDRLRLALTGQTVDQLDLGAVDAVVTDGEAGPALLEQLRDGDRVLPVVVYTDAPRRPILDAIGDARFVDLVQAGDDGGLDVLAHRLCRLVDHRRTHDLARRASAATEAATDGLAVLSEDGTVAFANSQLARKLGYDRAELHGRPWRELFDEASVGRLETDALSAVEDGWQWVGTTDGRRADGETVALRTLVTDAGDGLVVIAVLGTDPDDSE